MNNDKRKIVNRETIDNVRDWEAVASRCAMSRNF